VPNAIRVYTALRNVGIQDGQALAVGIAVANSQSPRGLFRRDETIDLLCDEGFAEETSEALADTVAHCFPSERFSRHFNRTALKTALVRAGFSAPIAEALLTALAPCVVTPTSAEIRLPIARPPRPGQVVMCDFRFLTPPEMQKERRAIVVSTPSASGIGRCAVVPVSMSPSILPNPHHHEFPAGKYRFFSNIEPVWAVCDHVYTVSLHRIWQVNVNRRPTIPSISEADLVEVREKLGTALGV
jgi:uncharacterized protein YifN (PemK superfamily)